MFTDFNWIAHWNFLLVSWFSKLLLSVLGVCPLIGSFRKILLLQFWLLGLDSVYRKALYGINLLTTVVMRGENVRFLAWSHLASEKALNCHDQQWRNLKSETSGFRAGEQCEGARGVRGGVWTAGILIISLVPDPSQTSRTSASFADSNREHLSRGWLGSGGETAWVRIYTIP